MSSEKIADSTLEEDRALVLASIGGEKAAQKVLMARYHDKLLRFFRHRAGVEDFEDLQHDVWGILLDKKTAEPIKALNTSVRAYIYGIARNVLFNYYQKRKRTFDPITSSLEVFDATLSRQVAERQGASSLHEALPKLPIDDQVLLEMRYFEEMSTRELAEMYKVPIGTIRSRLFKARKALDEMMQRKAL
jgi:RNA polymerase sigma factor (sigma-70 family)